jgi:hypothetical protein
MTYKYIPTKVDLYSEDPENEISWSAFTASESDFLLQKRWRTVKPLVHRANSATGAIRNSTYSLICTDFNMSELPDEITGLELNLQAQRNGRISDYQIQLTYQNNPIGENNFKYITNSEGHFLLLNETTYGGPEDLWGTELTKEILQDPSFGVILKFQSHPYYPHSSGMLVESVSITVY